MSTMLERLAPSPPSSIGTIRPSRRCVRADRNASPGYRASRSTESALVSATAAVASAREMSSSRTALAYANLASLIDWTGAIEIRARSWRSHDAEVSESLGYGDDPAAPSGFIARSRWFKRLSRVEPNLRRRPSSLKVNINLIAQFLGQKLRKSRSFYTSELRSAFRSYSPRSRYWR